MWPYKNRGVKWSLFNKMHLKNNIFNLSNLNFDYTSQFFSFNFKKLNYSNSYFYNKYLKKNLILKGKKHLLKKIKFFFFDFNLRKQFTNLFITSFLKTKFNSKKIKVFKYIFNSLKNYLFFKK